MILGGPEAGKTSLAMCLLRTLSPKPGGKVRVYARIYVYAYIHTCVHTLTILLNRFLYMYMYI